MDDKSQCPTSPQEMYEASTGKRLTAVLKKKRRDQITPKTNSKTSSMKGAQESASHELERNLRGQQKPTPRCDPEKRGSTAILKKSKMER